MTALVFITATAMYLWFCQLHDRPWKLKHYIGAQILAFSGVQIVIEVLRSMQDVKRWTTKDLPAVLICAAVACWMFYRMSATGPPPED